MRLVKCVYIPKEVLLIGRLELEILVLFATISLYNINNRIYDYE